MTMRRKMLSLALAAVCFPAGVAIAQDSLSPTFGSSGSSVARIGDYAQSIGDSSSGDVEIYPDVRPLAFQSNLVDPDLTSTPNTSPFHSTSYVSNGGLTSTIGDYGTSSASNCGASSRTCVDASLPMNSEWYWFNAESLLWFGQSGRAPALVASSAAAGSLPIIGGNTTILAGGITGIDSGLLPGYRIDLGAWMDSDQTYGVGGRVFGNFGTDNSTTYASTGVPSLGIPFFNASLGTNDAYLVGFDAGNLGSNSGSITVTNNTRMISSELYGLSNVIKSGGNRTDLLVGYMFSRLDDSLGIRSVYTDGITNAIQNGTVFDVTDTFSGKNTFHGGELGLSSVFSCGRWSLRSLSKVAVGNMSQRVTVSGSYLETPPTGAPATESRGLFAQTGNIGTATRNQFGFIPEFGMKLGYDLNCQTRLSVGYTFIYWNNVALAGAQIDPTIDIGNILNNPTAPNSRFNSDGYWMQGVDLGLTYQF